MDVEHQGHASHWIGTHPYGATTSDRSWMFPEPSETNPLSKALVHSKHTMQAGEAGHACRNGEGAPVVTHNLPVWIESVVARWI